ncbi:MAG: Rpn family recombination-promoting nuclease/putative transposase [Bryobacterales bacterium]|nr:Rpn family recombination-promoting nuclease/putative transposase [Bryobacterales bacterium]
MKFDLNKPHDSIFQAILSDGLRSQAVLRAHLEPWQAELLADEPPVPLDRSFVDEELRSSQSDKLFEVRLRDGQPGFVYALLEHKSYPDPGTALQVRKHKFASWRCARTVRRFGCGQCRQSSHWSSLAARSPHTPHAPAALCAGTGVRCAARQHLSRAQSLAVGSRSRPSRARQRRTAQEGTAMAA